MYPPSYEVLRGNMLRFYPNKMKKSFFATLKFSVHGLCIAFVIWQTIKCMTKFLRHPQGTTISMENSSNVSFPAISVCGVFGKDNVTGYAYQFNKTHLEKVCGIR